MKSVLAAFLFGAITMSDTVTADEKVKPEPPPVRDGVTFDEKVSVKMWVKRQKVFLSPVRDLWARRWEMKGGGLRFGIIANADNCQPLIGSIIIDKAGNEYEVIEDDGAPYSVAVKLVKADPKGVAASPPKLMPEPKKP